MDSLIEAVQREVLNQLDVTRDFTDEEVREQITAVTRKQLSDRVLSLRERALIETSVFNSLRRLDVIQELVDDENVTEIMVNGANHIYYEQDGIIRKFQRHFASEEKLEDMIQRIVAAHNRVINLSSPIVDTRLENGSRVNIVLPPVSLGGATMTIRKFPKDVVTMQQLVQWGSISDEAADYLAEMVRRGKCILVTGGTGSGKTTMLNALSEFIPAQERVITIEDSAELQLNGIENLVRLETREANHQHVSEITIRDLIRTALRMRPDRIIVGECRGAEAFDMLQAMNTGHDGSMSTGHANSCKDMLSRLEMMVRMGMDLPLAAIRSQIASGIHLIVHVSRMPDHSRKVIEIAKLNGIEDEQIVLKTLFRWEDASLKQIQKDLK